LKISIFGDFGGEGRKSKKTKKKEKRKKKKEKSFFLLDFGFGNCYFWFWELLFLALGIVFF